MRKGAGGRTPQGSVQVHVHGHARVGVGVGSVAVQVEAAKRTYLIKKC